MSLLEQELLTLPGHLSSSPVFNGVRVLRSLVFCIVLFRSLFVLFLYLLVTVLSVLRFMDSDYPFGIYFTYFVPVFKYCYSDSRNL